MFYVDIHTYVRTYIDRLILKMACTRYNKSAFSHFVSDYTHMICICDLVYQILYFFYNKLRGNEYVRDKFRLSSTVIS